MPSKTTDDVPAKWDASQIPSLDGKVAIVTGANSGIGYVTALELARHGALVVLACRNEERGKKAERKLKDELKTSAGDVEFLQLDVSSLRSIKSFVQTFRAKHSRLDLLINNAGIMAVPFAETEDGLESQMATNHLGHFALTAQLFDLLQANTPSRIVAVSSAAHNLASKFDEDNIMAPLKKYTPFAAYANPSSPTSCTAETNLTTAPVENNDWFNRTVWKIARCLPIYQTAEMGALPTLYAATAPGVKCGQFFGPGGFMAMGGHPVLEKPAKPSESATITSKVWIQSEKLTGVTFTI
ncbi:hypothetical protein Poli38472_004867 [Pythium oligandrum]|uniref:Uncharacterized protein n=1 Tax=Pythium oligandrum TaxID=41045 RepID=A0A8K1CBV1_PYTOL|nr:hypothetical protein Poli38472_004867 [Pythium oligandrum]|eukprot:TMW59798.1 hypothetical protein Poli38472_004867 [Pythium oligandrum]